MKTTANAFAPAAARNALSVFLLAVTISTCYGLQYKASPEFRFSYYLAFSLAFLGILAVLTYSLVAARAAPVVLGRRIRWLGFAMMASSLTLTIFFQSKLLVPVPWYAVGLAALLAGLYVQWKWSSRGSTYLFAVAGLAFLTLYVSTTELWQKGDMLLVIEAAGKEVLAGRQPYRTYPEVYVSLAEKQPFPVLDVEEFVNRPRGSRVPMKYLPGTWIPYLPAIALGADLRLLNIVFLVGVVLAFERLVRGADQAPVVASLTLYPVLLSPSLLGIVSALHVVHYWLLLLLTVLFLQRERYGRAALFFGLALATRQGALFLVAPLVAYLSLRLRWMDIARYGLLALGVYVALTVPFAFWWGQDYVFFLKHLYLEFTSVSGPAYQVDAQVGLARLLERAGLSGTSTFIQIGILAVAAGYLVARREMRLGWAIQVFGVAYIWGVFFSPYAVRYEYYPGLLLVASGVAIVLANRSGSEAVGVRS